MDQKAKIPTTLNINSKDTAICDDKILNIQSSKIPTIKKSLVMTARSEATDSDNTRIRIGPTKKSTLPIAK